MVTIKKITNKKYEKNVNLTMILFLVITPIIVLLTACATNYGSLSDNSKVSRYFKTGFIPEKYTYYYNGWFGEPDAIVGIDPEYSFESKTWKRFDPKETSIRKMINRMYNRESTRFKGAWILGANGEKIGIWFSDSRIATIKMADEKRIAFITPEPIRRKTMFGD